MKTKSVKPLTKLESAKLGAAIILLRRGNVPLARRVLTDLDKVKIAEDVTAYIREHSKYKLRMEGKE